MKLNEERMNVVLKIKNGSRTMDYFTLNVQLSTIQNIQYKSFRLTLNISYYNYIKNTFSIITQEKGIKVLKLSI